MSAYMTLEKYAATLKVGDEVTIEYHSMAGVSEYLAYLQNPLGATLNYLITGR